METIFLHQSRKKRPMKALRTKTIYRIITSDYKVYIGASRFFKKRITNHKSDCFNKKGLRYNFPLYQHIRALGSWDDVEFEKLLEVPEEFADIVERNYISFYRANNPEFGHNKCSGGQRGYTQSKDSMAASQDNNPNRMSVIATLIDTGKYVGIYPSQRAAAEALDVQQTGISKVILGFHSHAGPYFFTEVPKEETK